MAKVTQGRDSALLCSEVNFERNSMEVRTEDSLENQENSGVMKENPMQHNSMFLWMFALFLFLKTSFTDNKHASSLYRPT